ncbi:MAG: hypothetical protein JWM91_1883 [Rhodospirillales bacterium]|nr:hypothetical protein [Rhodospirillales bacterium]
MLSSNGKAFGKHLAVILAASVLGVAVAGATSSPAKADGWHHGRHHGWNRGWDHGWNRGWDHGWYGPRVGLGFGVYPPPAYYYPPRPRVYYPPAYYPPAYYGAPYYAPYGGFNVTIPIR